MTNAKNYFKSSTYSIDELTKKPIVKTEIFFFDERSPDGTRSAYEGAMDAAAMTGGKVSVYRIPPIVGPWFNVQHVGIGIGTYVVEDEEAN